MTSTMMVERTTVGVPGVGTPGVGVTGMGGPGTVPGTSNWLMVPRCTYKFEKVQGGLKVTCVCEDKVATGMVQNLCTMLTGGMCSFTCTCNGMTVCCCNLTMGLCKVEPTKDGVCVTCTSGDPKCCEMIQACCDCLTTLVKDGCPCCLLMNGTPVCCGCC